MKRVSAVMKGDGEMRGWRKWLNNVTGYVPTLTTEEKQQECRREAIQEIAKMLRPVLLAHGMISITYS
jgi:hypothetical protein